MDNPKCESIWITHVVNPHQFYYKCTSDIANSEFSKFDFEIQLYGNQKFARQNETDDHGYTPAENELVIFYHIIYNKWIRGRVVSLGQEITFWCIDNGVYEKWAAPHVLQLTKRFHEDMKCVNLGGLSLVPTEKTLNVETVEVETLLSQQWDQETINLFKQIIDSSTTFMFTTEFQLENHKFGSLVIVSKYATKNINKVLLAMNRVAPSNQYTDDDLWCYVHDARLETQLHQSIINGSSVQPSKLSTSLISMKAISRSSIKSGSVISSVESLGPNEDFDDSKGRQSSSDISAVTEPKTSSRASIHDQISLHQSDVIRYENAMKSENSSAADEFLEDFNKSVSLVSSSTENCLPSHSQNNVKPINDACYLRTFKADFRENVKRQPLETTLAWIDSMIRLNSSDNDTGASSIIKLNGEGRSTLSNENLSFKSGASRGRMLATLAKNKFPMKTSNIVNNSAIGDKRFGIPAGYAKNDLDTFGGLNKS